MKTFCEMAIIEIYNSDMSDEYTGIYNSQTISSLKKPRTKAFATCHVGCQNKLEGLLDCKADGFSGTLRSWKRKNVAH